MIRNFARETKRLEFFWRYGSNLGPSIDYRLGGAPSLNDSTVRRVLKDLNRNGIAITSADELLSGSAVYSELSGRVDQMLIDRHQELEALKSSAEQDVIGEKTFNVEMLGSIVEFNPECVFARFALQDKFLDIADAYFGMRVKLRYYNVWKTFATHGAPRESQLWHYDREDKYILKVFMYLRDVDEGTGPFTYAPQTHPKGTFRGREPEHFLEGGVRRSTDEQMNAVVPRCDWIRATGNTGTIIFADTRGFHKGGEARKNDRLMYTCLYTSRSSESRRLVRFGKSPEGLSNRQISALLLDDLTAAT